MVQGREARSVGKAGDDQADVSFCSPSSQGTLGGVKPGRLGGLGAGPSGTRCDFENQESTGFGCLHQN